MSTPNPLAVQATPFDWAAWTAADYPDHGVPGQAGRFPADLDSTGDHLMFACPGCGRYGGIRAGALKPAPSPSWQITAGTLADVTTLTLSPSILCVGCCGWHGHLTAGVFTPC